MSYLFSVAGTAARSAGSTCVVLTRCTILRRVQRRKELPKPFVAAHSFRPLLRGRGHRSAMSLPSNTHDKFGAGDSMPFRDKA
jgi:hypothetical protein